MISRGPALFLIQARSVLSIGLVLLACHCAVAADHQGIAWRGDLGTAQQEALARDRPLWIQFTGPWCSYCRLMDRDSFTHQGVINHAEGTLIPLKLQADVYEELASRLGITGLPATVIVSPSGNVLAMHQGFLDGASFQSFLESALTKHAAARPPVKPAVEETTAAAPSEPESKPIVGLAGYCPVSLVRGQALVVGKDDHQAEHAGRLYLFADELGRAEFLQRPERYVPVNNGQCPVSQVDRGELRQGHPRFGILFGGHLYLCADEDQRSQFLKTPQRYARVNKSEREFCLHCWGRDIFRDLGSERFTKRDSRDLNLSSRKTANDRVARTDLTLRPE